MQDANSQLVKNQKTHTVAVVLKDREDEGLYRLPLEKSGAQVICFDNFKSFWNEGLKQSLTLAIVDVRMMSHENHALKDHPLIKSEKLPLIFVYDQKSTPLLYSTYNIFCLGHLNRNLDVTGQLKSLLGRFNKFLQKEKEIKRLKAQEQKLDSKVEKIFMSSETFKKRNSLFEGLIQILKQLETYQSISDFNTIVDNILSQWEVVENYSIYELNTTGQKLVCPELVSKRYRKLPPLWLGQDSKGIEFYAQNMAAQVAIELLGNDLITLKVFGADKSPRKLIFIKINNGEFFVNFDWTTLELYLSGVYSQLELRKSQTMASPSLLIQPWDLLAKLDEQKWNVENAEKRVTLIDINLEKLVESILATPQIKFFWGEFINEFVLKFKNVFSHDFQVASVNIGHLGFIVDQEKGNLLFDELKKFSEQFPYWKFFEDFDLILPKDISPNLKMVPSSPQAYFKYLKEL